MNNYEKLLCYLSALLALGYFFSKKTNTKISFWGIDEFRALTFKNAKRPQLSDIQKVSGHEQSILHLRDHASFLASSSVNVWWLLFAFGKIQFHFTCAGCLLGIFQIVVVLR